MALSASILKLNVTLDRDASGGPVFVFQDSTDYTGNGVTLANVEGTLKVEYGSTSLYDNLADWADPDIAGNSLGQSNEDLLRSRTQATAIALPTDSGGEIFSGSYKFTYQVTDDNGTSSFTAVGVVDATFTTPEGNLSSVVDLTPTAPKITITDNTNYVVQNVSPASANPTITCYFPDDASVSPAIASASELEVTTFYTGQQIGTLSAVKSWDYSSKIDTATTTFTSGFFTVTISDTVTDRILIDVETNTNTCTLFCCLKEFLNDLLAAKAYPSKYEKLKSKAGVVAVLWNGIDSAYKCSKTESINAWVLALKDTLDCDEDCPCDDGQPIQISAIAAIGAGTVWGDITGTLADQTDLQAALDAKLAALVEDTTPQLGGNLDGQSTHSIVNLVNINGTAVAVIISGAALGATAMQELVDDTVPVLGGPLDTKAFPITGNSEFDGRRPMIEETTTARNLILADAGHFIHTTNVAAVTITIPTNASIAFPVGTEIDIFQEGTGAVTVTAAGGVTLNGSAAGSVNISAQWKSCTIKKIATDEWIAVGSI